MNLKKVPLRILDKDFNLLAEIDDYESLIFTRSFFSIGEFELKININKNNTDKLLQNNLILLKNRLNKVGIIMHRECGMDQDGEPSDTLFIKGYELKELANRRVIVPGKLSNGYDNAIGNIETIMKQFVRNNLADPENLERKIDKVDIAEDRKRGKQDKWRGRYENLADKLSEIGEYAQVGWYFILDIRNRKFIFDVSEGRNLSVNQDIMPPTIFSMEFNNISRRNYMQSSLSHKNIVYAGGRGEEEERLVLQIGSISGFERIESFQDCSSAEDAVELTILGEQKLDELKEVKSFEAQIVPNNSFRYEEDYNLGDIVTIQDKRLGLTMDSRIIEIREIYDENGFELEATFGTNIPTIADKIKKNTRKIVR